MADRISNTEIQGSMRPTNSLMRSGGTPTEDAIKAVGAITTFFPSTQVGKETIVAYAGTLSLVPISILQSAVRELCLKKKTSFFPSLGEILNQAARLDLRFPTVEKAIENVAWVLAERGRSTKDCHKAVIQAAKTVNVRHLHETGNQWRPQFRVAYEGIVESQINEWIDEITNQGSHGL